MVSIYFCDDCNRALDKLALRLLSKKENFRKIKREHDSILNYALAADRSDLNWFLVSMPFKCGCGKKHFAYYRTRFLLNPEVPFRSQDFKVIHITGTHFVPIDGLHLGRKIKWILRAFLARWNILADHVLICTPFISSRFTSSEWKWLMKHVSQYLTHIITRPQSKRLLKRLSVFQKKSRWDILAEEPFEDITEALEERFIRPVWIESQVIEFQKFHAKYFAGIFSDHVEVMHTSFNLFEKEETQLENLCVEIYHREYFFDRFIRPFGIEKLISPPDSRLELSNQVGVVYCEKKNDLFEVQPKYYRNRVWELIQEMESERRARTTGPSHHAA